MRYKTLPGLCLAMIFLSSVLFAGPAEFRKGVTYLTPQVGVNTWTVPFGVNVEHAITPNIGIGGTGLLWLFTRADYDYSIVTLYGDVAYHFTKLNARNLDLYAGGGLGFHVVSKTRKNDIFEPGEHRGGASGLFLLPFVGLRYYLSPKVALSFRLNVGIFGDWSGVDGLIGVTFRLK